MTTMVDLTPRHPTNGAGVSLVTTVRNEAASIDGLLASIGAQTALPDEIVIVDGGSTDDTVARIQRWREAGLPIRLVEAPGANIARGRNLAIAAARHEVITVTDAGVRLAPKWLAEITAPLRRGEADVVAGFFRSDPRNAFEVAMGATVLPVEADIDPTTFLPSSRSVAFTRAAWREAGGYPEWLDYCEDIVFDLALRAGPARFAWAPAALVHFRPRGSLPAFFLQYFRYARGDGKARLFGRRHAIRYCVYVTAAVAVWSGFWYKRSWIALAIAGLPYLWTPYRRLAPHLARLNWGERILAGTLVPVLRLTGDLAKMVGYPVGWWWRLRQRVDHRRASVDASSSPPTTRA